VSIPGAGRGTVDFMLVYFGHEGKRFSWLTGLMPVHGDIFLDAQFYPIKPLDIPWILFNNNAAYGADFNYKMGGQKLNLKSYMILKFSLSFSGTWTLSGPALVTSTKKTIAFLFVPIVTSSSIDCRFYLRHFVLKACVCPCHRDLLTIKTSWQFLQITRSSGAPGAAA